MKCRIRCLIPIILSTCVAGCSTPPQSKQPDSAARASTRNISRSASTPRQATDDSPVDTLTVDGETISASDLCREMWRDLLSKNETVEREEYETFVQRSSAQWIGDKITEMLLYQQASRRQPEKVQENIDKYVDAEIRKIVTAQHGGIQRRYENHLALQGQTLDDVRARLRREIIITSYLEAEIKPKIAEPTRADLFAAFQDNLDAWRRPERRRMSLIDVRVLDRLADDVNNPSREQLEAARAEARSIMESARLELRNGASFADVARRHSDGLHKSEGGSWGWVTPGSVRERFEPAVEELYRLNEQETSEVIATDNGFFLVHCDEIDRGAEPTFQDVQPDLKQAYIRNSYNRLLAELVTDLRSKARIEPADLNRFRASVIETAANETFSETP